MNKSILFRDATIHYSVTGSGTAVVLIHGFAEDGRIWSGVTKGLDYLLIIPDLPGSGRSELLSGNVTLDDYAECIKLIMDNEKIHEAVIIGHSMGGYISLAFAEKYPKTIVALGLFHSSAYADDKEKIETRNKAIGFIRENSAAAFLKTSIPGLFHDPSKSRKDIDKLLANGLAFKPEALIQYYEAMIARPDRTNILKQSAFTFLFIMGEHDKAVPFEHSLRQSQLPEHSYVYILRNSAHMGMLEEEGKSREILAKFLQGVCS